MHRFSKSINYKYNAPLYNFNAYSRKSSPYLEILWAYNYLNWNKTIHCFKHNNIKCRKLMNDWYSPTFKFPKGCIKIQNSTTKFPKGCIKIQNRTIFFNMSLLFQYSDVSLLNFHCLIMTPSQQYAILLCMLMRN